MQKWQITMKITKTIKTKNRVSRTYYPRPGWEHGHPNHPLLLRLPGGTLYVYLKDVFQCYARERSRDNRNVLIRALRYYVLGFERCNRSGKYMEMQIQEEQPKGDLYHWALQETVPEILREGLKPGNIHFVYLTDDPEYLLKAGYGTWKATVLNREITLVCLKVDAVSLSRKYPLHRIYDLSNHKFTVSKVPADYISVAFR